MRVRPSKPALGVTSATIDACKDEPQTTVTFRVWDDGCDLLVFFTPFPKQGQRSHDQSEPVRLA